MRTLPFAAALLALALAPVAGALDDDDDDDGLYSRKGFYLTAQGYYALEFFDDDHVADRTSGGNVHFKDFPGASGSFGWRFHPRFSAEIQGDWIRPATVELGSADVGNVEGTIFTLNGKVYALTGRIQPYGLVGIGGGWINLQDTATQVSFSKEGGGFAARFGAGSDFYLSHAFGLTVGTDFVLPTGAIGDYPHLRFLSGFFLRF